MAGYLAEPFLGKPAWMWLFFAGVVLVLLVLDLGLFHRKDHEIGVRESLSLSAFYIALGVGFGGWVWWELGRESGVEYLTGFVVEKSLAMDNVFVIAMIFGYFQVPRMYQHRVLFWGILGVILLRGAMIAGGAALVERYDWVLYVFAGFLVLTGLRMLREADREYDIRANPVLRFVRKHLRVTDELHGHAFFVRLPDPATGHRRVWMTPLFLALMAIETADVIFAVDSVPAIFAITTDPYLVFTSNIFAILGLRALYFALAAILYRFQYLKYALSVLLIFIGSKVFVAPALGLEKFPASWSLSGTAIILGSGILYSWARTRTGRSAA